jgi:cysteine-S-conjugate beta-lyase
MQSVIGTPLLNRVESPAGTYHQESVMSSDFDCYIERRCTDSVKWTEYGEDVLPMWVADMDFAAPPAVIDALQDRISHGVFGYAVEPPELCPVLVARLAERYGWQVSPEDLVFMPGVVVGFNLAAQAVGKSGDGMLLQTPVYYPMIRTPKYADMTLHQMALTQGADGRYGVDLELMERTLTDRTLGERTRMFLLCNPHNPVGRAFTRQELSDMAALCLRHDLVICSDEIHCDLTYAEHTHTPIAALDEEIAQRTITLMAPSKAFNIAGLKFSFAVIQNPELRKAYTAAWRGIVPSVSVLAYAAGLAAYRDCDPWLAEALAYLQANRDHLCATVDADMPGIRMACPDATYLAWLDCREAALPGGAYRFFLQHAGVALNDGAPFGPGGEGFVRLNFGCCREILDQALDRMRAALAQHAP